MKSALRPTLLATLMGLMTPHCTQGPDNSSNLYTGIDTLPEAIPIELQLEGEAGQRDAQFSGMAWCGDHLILLPQYPAFPSRGSGGYLFSIKKQDLLSAIKDPSETVLIPHKIAIESPDFLALYPGYEGYEAITFGTGTDSLIAWVTLEVEPSEGNAYGILLRGRMTNNMTTFTIDTLPNARIASQSNVPNMAEETLLLINDSTVLTFHEANAISGNSESGVAHCLTASDFEPCGTYPIPVIPYRITDATEVDSAGRFWVINMFYPGEKELSYPSDPIANQFGIGSSHTSHQKVERLLELEIKENRIDLAEDCRPIYLSLTTAPGESRNWEGIARLDSLGLLIITDTYPKTILAFVPF
jgi:hypothetical protein